MPSCPTAQSVYGRPLLQAAREIGKHLATFHRWRDPGVFDARGVRRRLQMTRVGGRWYVRDEDLSAFFATLAATEGEPTAASSNSDAQRKSDEWTGRELDEAGICEPKKK